MAPPKRNDPYERCNFLLEIDGIPRAGFSEVSGLTAEIAVIEYREGSDSGTSRKLPGMRKYSNITLKRGLTKDATLWNWWKNVSEGTTDRRSGSIILLDEKRQPAVRWNFREGWPCKWEGPALNARANEVAIETLEIVHEGFEMES